jgi:hypothetical protein
VHAACAVAGLVATWAPQALAERKLEQGETVQETYELNALDLVVTTSDPTAASGGPWRPVRGKYRWAMTYGEFYDAVGRPDLSARQTRRDILSGTLTWGGVAVMVAGGYLLVRGLGSEGFNGGAQLGLGLVLGGATSAVIGRLLDGAVISDHEAAQLAEAYNGSLRRQLQGPRSGWGDGLRWSVALVPVIEPNAFGLSLGGSF